MKNEHDIDRNDEWFLSQENKRAFISPINILDKVKTIISNIGSNQCVSDQPKRWNIRWDKRINIIRNDINNGNRSRIE